MSPVGNDFGLSAACTVVANELADAAGYQIDSS